MKIICLSTAVATMVLCALFILMLPTAECRSAPRNNITCCARNASEWYDSSATNSELAMTSAFCGQSMLYFLGSPLEAQQQWAATELNRRQCGNVMYPSDANDAFIRVDATLIATCELLMGFDTFDLTYPLSILVDWNNGLYNLTGGPCACSDHACLKRTHGGQYPPDSVTQTVRVKAPAMVGLMWAFSVMGWALAGCLLGLIVVIYLRRKSIASSQLSNGVSFRNANFTTDGQPTGAYTVGRPPEEAY